MFHMLGYFDLKPVFRLHDVECALDEYMEHMHGLDLVESREAVGWRQSDTIMDTDDERGHPPRPGAGRDHARGGLGESG